MKIIYTLIAIVGIITLTFAQLPNTISGKKISKEVNFDLKKFASNKNKVNKTATVFSGWFNYGTSIDAGSLTSASTASYLFPDTLGYCDFGPPVIGPPSFEPCFVHHLGDVLDVKGLPFMADPNTNFIGSTKSYLLDSISIVFEYKKNIIGGSNDTLIVTLFANTNPLNLLNKGIVDPLFTTNYGTDTVSFKDIGYDYLTNSILASGSYQFKVFLMDIDTVNGFIEKKIKLPTPFYVPAGKLLATDVQFKPGYTYTIGTHIDVVANAFRFLSVEEKGYNTFQTYYDCNFGSAACDWNCSYIIDKSVRYNMSGGGWNGHFMPSYAFTSYYSFEHHLISYHLLDTASYPCVVTSSISILADTLVPGNYNCYDFSTGTGTLSYLWNFGDGTTSILTAPSHTYSPPGAYVVCLTVSANSGTSTCTDTYCDSSSVLRMSAGFLMSQFNVIPQTITSVKQIENVLNINSYPNPITDELNIKVTSNKEVMLNYLLVDGLGRIIFRGEINNNLEIIKTSSLDKGFYNLTLFNSDGILMKTIKLVK
jgi:hypothetical protein